MNKYLIIIYTLIQLILLYLCDEAALIIEPQLLFYLIIPIMLAYGVVKGDKVCIAFPILLNAVTALLQFSYYTNLHDTCGNGFRNLTFELISSDFIVFSNFLLFRIEPLVFTIIPIILGLIIRKIIINRNKKKAVN